MLATIVATLENYLKADGNPMELDLTKAGSFTDQMTFAQDLKDEGENGDGLDDKEEKETDLPGGPGLPAVCLMFKKLKDEFNGKFKKIFA